MDFSKEWEDPANCRCSDRLKPLERRKARQHQRCLAHSLVGTPNYIAPEVLLRTGTSTSRAFDAGSESFWSCSWSCWPPTEVYPWKMSSRIGSSPSLLKCCFSPRLFPLLQDTPSSVTGGALA